MTSPCGFQLTTRGYLRSFRCEPYCPYRQYRNRGKADCICGTFFYAGGAAPAILGIFDVRFAVFVGLDKTSGADIATPFAAYALGLVNYYAHTFHLPLQGHE